jgi:hypothetical protein
MAADDHVDAFVVEDFLDLVRFLVVLAQHQHGRRIELVAERRQAALAASCTVPETDSVIDG